MKEVISDFLSVRGIQFTSHKSSESNLKNREILQKIKRNTMSLLHKEGFINCASNIKDMLLKPLRKSLTR